MTAIALRIVEPAHDTVFAPTTPPTPVKFRGAPVTVPSELHGVPLFYRWYSSLHLATDPPFSLIPTSDPAIEQAPALVAGTHVVTLAVTDKSGEGAGAQKEVGHGGVTGGAVRTDISSRVQAPCVIHVLRAVILPPDGTPWQISLAACAIDVEGTPLWITEKYQAVNRLRYRLIFQPKTPGAAIDIPLAAGAFPDPKREYQGPWSVTRPDVLRYGGSLPGLTPGKYGLRLRVEDLHGPKADETASFDVEVTA